ncbi:hypothetical protein BCV78_23880 [Salmonella enterica]|nr:hypothetical protein [Salmonella enterica]EAS3314177.1 hypothetical protein [Salmonella enterica]EBL3145518.1 hypothetical protein [Salmonella enterica]EBN5582997.1 hypothetical protein [Salmonella enterica]EBQ3427973.1 hypothetical protein [Salmonella enterica]
MIFWLADRWGEPDPAKIAALPADTLFHWRAFFLKQGIFQRPEAEDISAAPFVEPSPATVNQSIDDQCAAVMRALM